MMIQFFAGRFLVLLLAAGISGMAGACETGSRERPDADISLMDAAVDGESEGGPQDADLPDAELEPIVMGSQAYEYAVDPSPPNPVTGEEAPVETEKILVIRYYAQNPRQETQAIVLAYPGVLLGAGSYRNIAANLISRSEGAIEVWAYERRGNYLEDRTGINAAVAQEDVNLAVEYYSGEREINGKSFEGVIAGHEPSFMSEWGLVQEVEQLAMVLGFVEEEDRRSNVILMGFSLGAPLVGQFAAWDFDGKKASDDLAGVIMLDGGGLGEALTENEYHNIGCTSSFGLQLGLDSLRRHGPYLQEMGLDSGIWIALELAALRTSGLFGDPDAEWEDQFLKHLVGIYLDKPHMRLTSEAALGVIIDDQFSPALFMRAGLGNLTGGPLEEYENIFSGETLLRPANTEDLYSWLHYDEVEPNEFSCVNNMALAVFSEPGGALEWYSPVRLNLDVCACDDFNVAASEDDYRWRLGMRVTRNAEMDAPVLFFVSEYGEIWDMSFVENYRLSLPPVGEGRPNAGAPRDSSLPPHLSGFSLVMAPRYHHMDAILAASDAGNDYLYEPLLDFILANTEGTVSAALP